MTSRSTVLKTMADRWRGFWFTPESAETLGLVRIAFGVLVLAWSASLLPDWKELFSAGGVVADPPTSSQFIWGLLHIWQSDTAVLAVWAVLVLSAVALVVGWHSRLAAIAVFVCILSFQRRDPYVFNSGDTLIRVEAFLLALAPSGAALSLDQHRTTGSFRSAQIRAPWVIRLMQVQLSLIYLAAVHSKLRGDSWNNGTAVSYALQLPDMTTFDVPRWLTDAPVLVNALTWSALALELALAVLVWNRHWRPVVLTAGIAMHLTMMTVLGIAYFSWAMFILYLAFLNPLTVRRFFDRLAALALPTRVTGYSGCR